MLPTFYNQPRASDKAKQGIGEDSGQSGRRRSDLDYPTAGVGDGAGEASNTRRISTGSSVMAARKNRNKSSSIPELPALAKPPNKQQGTGNSDRRPGKVIRIGAFNHSVPTRDLKHLKEQFDVLDDKNSGVVCWSKLQSMDGGGAQKSGLFALKTIQTNNAKIVRQRATMAMRVADGMFSFKDLLRIRYPQATEDDINEMDLVARELTGETIRTRQYPKLRREAAENQFSQLANQHGDLYLDALEDYMISRWPDQNTYELLKLLSPEAVNRLYDGKPITQDEFVFWFLKLEDVEDEASGGSRNKTGRKNQAMSNYNRKLMAKSADPYAVFGSYVSRKPTLW